MIKEEDIVLCTVKRIEATTVFLEIEGNGEGNLAFPEIAAGRIRNLREYIVPNKKIVCKVLRIVNSHPELSLRRVTAKERELVLNKYKKEKTILTMLKTILKDSEKIIKKIKEEEIDLVELFEEAKTNAKKLEKFFPKESIEKIIPILQEKQEKEKFAKKIITLNSDFPSGINDIKSILKIPEIKISYLGSSMFSISISGKNFKEAEQKLSQIIEKIKLNCSEKKVKFGVKEK